MKRCPQCNRTYTDDALSFCLDDGSPLQTASAPPAYDPSATVQYPPQRATTPQPTIAYPGQAPPPMPPPMAPPAWGPMPPPQARKRSAWPWIIGIGVVLMLMGIGIVILFIAIASVTNDNNNNRVANANANSRSANRNSNSNSNANVLTNSNSDTRSTLTNFTDDFSAQSWGVGPSQYGNIWYQDGEYHMHAVKGSYIVMYGPDKKEYYDENATVRVGLRSIDGDAPNHGYGLVVHGEKKEGGKLEDYGFLISNGTEPYYEVILHKAGVETKIVDKTPSSVIRAGTSPNQLEVRIRDLRLDFYINGQFITSITDTAGYHRGRVGFYTSDAGEVAFDDLEISK